MSEWPSPLKSALMIGDQLGPRLVTGPPPIRVFPFISQIETCPVSTFCHTYYGSEALAEGKITGKEGDKFTAGRLGQYTVGANGEVVLGPAQIVTTANVDEFKF